MRTVLVQEGNTEVFIYLERRNLSRLEALQEAIRQLSMEIIRYELNSNRNLDRPAPDYFL